jgi:tetratricopeptide (TPR) repeat protein
MGISLMNLEHLISLINDPYNDMNNFNLGYEYETLGQTATALSYYLRCAEYTEDDNLSYECMLRMSKCLSKQGHRDLKELTCLEHAISIKSNRPEAYHIMSLYHSFRENWLKSYMYACIGLQYVDNKSRLIKDMGYQGYQLLFQKAYSGYNKGKIRESKKIYYELLENNHISTDYKNMIMRNVSIRDSHSTPIENTSEVTNYNI